MKLENGDRNRGKIPSVASFSSALQLQCVAVTGFLSQNTKEMCLQVSSMWHCQASEISFSCGLDVLIRFIPGRDSWAVTSSGKVDSSLSWGSSGCFLRGCGFCLFVFFFPSFFSVLSEATEACPTCCVYVAGECMCVKLPISWHLDWSSAKKTLRNSQWQQMCFHVMLLTVTEVLWFWR